MDDFEDSEEIFEAVGEVLQVGSSDKSEEDIRYDFIYYIVILKFTNRYL